MTQPAIRLKGFTETWIKSELSTYSSPYFVSNKLRHHQNLLSLSYGQIKRKDIKSQKGLLPASFDTYQIIENGIIVFRFTDLQNDHKSLRVAISKEEGIISPAYICIKCKDILPDFLYLQLYAYDLRKMFYKMGDGMRQCLSYNDVKNLPLFIPSQKEQEAIVKYFTSLDNEISSSEKRLNRLKNIKSACLQSMFPQEGESFPKVRFKGFKEEWQEKSAESIFRTFNERNRPDLPVLSATQDKGMVKRESIGYNIFHDISNEATYKHILPGQFVIHLRSFQGGFAHSLIEGIASPAYTVIDFIDKGQHFDLFWKYIFSSKDFIKRLELITYGIRDGRSISFDEFKGMTFLIPSLEEQQQIASYFENLDKQIALQTQRLEKLKQIKSACLDKMFV